MAADAAADTKEMHMDAKRKVEIGQVYSAKVGGSFVAVRADKSLGHGRYEGVTMRPEGTGPKVKFCTDAVRGEGMSQEQWRERHAPKQHDLPMPSAAEVAQYQAKGKRSRAVKETGDRKPSGLDAAVRVLREAGTPLGCGDMVKTALEKGYWQTGGKTPAATIYAAIITEIAKKGAASRFRKTGRGMFELTDAAKEAK
jgi:hypothetical protein